MIVFLARRISLLLVTLFITSAIIFALTQVLPGDPARLILGRDARPEAIEQLRQELGLNDPVPMQYLRWLGRFVSGDWGLAYTSGQAPIQPLVTERLTNSLQLAALALLFSVPLSILLGVIAGLQENRLPDSLISVVTLSVVGLPEFVTGLILINVFALNFDLFPTASSPPAPGDPVDFLRQLTLPALTATFVLMAYIVRMTRAGVIEELKRPYVRTAILKGLPYRAVVVKHVLRNALLPTITVVALSFGWLVGGLIVIENVFNYPGLGRLMTTAVERKDLPLLQASVMIVVFMFALANVIADVLYALLNPRVRLE